MYSSGSLSTAHPAPASGNNNCGNPGLLSGDDGEAILDAEWASAAAPGANIIVAACADTYTTFGGLIAMQNLVNSANPPAIMSISYGECEAENGASSNAAFSALYQQAVAEGVSVFVSAGDEGCGQLRRRSASPRRTESASARLRPRPTMSRWAARIFPIPPPAPTIPIGAALTAARMARLSPTFPKLLGTIPAPAGCW